MVILVMSFGIGLHRAFGKIKQLFCWRCYHEVTPGFVNPHIDQLPVIESGALEMPIIDFETQWFYQVEGAERGCAKSGYATGIGWNFGLN
jgi:hypothetical protein